MTDEDDLIEIDAGALHLVLGVGGDGRLHQLGFGPDAIGRSLLAPIELHPLAYPTHGEEPLREPALRITHGDGVTSTRLRFERVTATSAEHGVEHRVELGDRVAPVAVHLVYTTDPEHGVLAQRVEVINRGERPICLHQAAASAPAFAGEQPTLNHWGGGWAAEWTPTTEPLHPGTKVVASTGGVRPALYRVPAVLLGLDGEPAEDAGRVVLATVAWGGDVRFDAEVHRPGQVRLLAGHQHRGAERVLDPGAAFVSPEALWAWSDEGVGPLSRRMHRYIRERIVRDGARPRATVANTWEALGFELDSDRLTAQIEAAADLGLELFLLDDGWFGASQPRLDDTTGLGDWAVDVERLAGGLTPLVERARERGMRFGLWIEPEMVNPESELYTQHPDWVVHEPGRDRRTERQQLVLDLCRPEVRAHVVATVDRLLAEHPGIDHLKWDANRDVTEPGSTTLPPDRQSHLPIDRVSATWRVMSEVAQRHPTVDLMLCASGGGRIDLGTLRWFHEVWTSDNTDPVDRVRIQWGASHLLPASVLAAHVTRWGDRPIGFGCAVAMSGRFGFDLDLTALTEQEGATCRQAVVTYRRIRDLVHGGDLHRLVSPLEGDRGALAYVDGDRSRAAVFAFRLPGDPEADVRPPVCVTGLDADCIYQIVDCTPGTNGRNLAAQSGSSLATAGLPWPAGPPPVAAVWELLGA